MTDLIKRDDALAAAGVIYKWSIAAAEELEAAIAAMPAIDPAAIREAALQDRIEELGRSRKDLEKLSIKLLNEKLQGEWREPLVAELEAAEAKLTKAVEALRHTLDKPRSAEQTYAALCSEIMWEIRFVLAELEGEE